MADAGVIIDAKLNSENLTNQIDKLVTDVDSKMKQLAQSFSESVNQMAQSFSQMKNQGGSSRTNDNKREQQSVKELTTTYDALGSAMQQLGAKIRQRWDISDIQNYRMQMHQLESEMNRLAKLSWNQGYDEWIRVGKQIDETRTKIQQLVQEQERLKSMPIANRFEEQQRLQQYQQLGTQIDALKRKEDELITVHKRTITEFSRETPAGKQFQEVRSQYDAVKQKIREMGQAMVDEDAKIKRATEQQAESVRRLAEIREQANRNSRAHSGIEIGSIEPATEADIQRRLQLERQEFDEIERARQATAERIAAEGQLTQVVQQRQQPKTFSTYDDLRSAIASVLNMQREEIHIADQSTASYNRLSLSLSQMSEAYKRLNASQRQSENGKNLANEIQLTQRAIQQLQQQMNRPVSLKNALGLSEKTLDDIIYKMQMLSRYRGGIDLTKPNSSQEIEQVNNALDRLKAKQQQIIGQNKQLQDSNTWLARSFQYMKNRLAFYFTIGASTQFVKNLIEIRSQYEMTERALGILVDSAERGSQIFNELSTMALQSPYTLLELSQAAKQLTAYDVAAKDVVDTTRRLADMAAAVGVNIDRLTYALGQVKAYGYLNARDARMFANAGIPLVKQLADYYTELEGRMVSVGDVYDRIKKKAVGYEDTMAVITKMTDEGGKFFDFQAKMADTLKVQLANLTLAWNNMLNSIGESNQGLLTFPIKALKELFANWKMISATIKDVGYAFLWLKALQIGYVMVTQKVSLALATVDVVGLRVIKVIKSLGMALKTLFLNPWTWVLVGVTALVELYQQTNREKEAAEQLSAAIEQSAEDSVKSLQKFKELNEDSIKDLNAGVLKPDDAFKLWASLQEELENSADSSGRLVSQLIQIPDIGERIKTALDYSQRIQEANEALKDLRGDLIKINTDVAWGALGEGLISDLKDWSKAISKYQSSFTTINGNPAANAKYWDEEEEALKEIGKIAEKVGNIVENALGEEGMKDHVKVEEAVARIKQQIKLENPEIHGALADLFDIELDQILGARWQGVYDNTITLWDRLMNEVKKTSTSEFSNITQEWIDGSEEMTEEQKKAFTDAANHLKETLPPTMHQVLDQMMADINSRNFRINVGIAFNVKQLDDVQKDFNRHFLGSAGGNSEIKAPMGMSVEGQRAYIKAAEEERQKYSRFNKKENESTLAWQKRLTDEYKAQNDNLKVQQGRLKSVSEVVRADAQSQISYSQDLLDIIKQVGDWEGFDVTGAKDKKSKKTTNKSRVKEEDLVAKALKEELSVINEMQSAYDKLRKAGVGSTEALQLASSGYDKTLKSINATLSKYGIKAFKAEDFVGNNDPHKLLKALEDQLDTLVKSGKVKTSSLKDLEMEIKKIRVDAREYDMKKITDGLNNELGKIKEEYELAVELDANPELGQMFAESFGIDTTNFPKTVQEAVDMMQDAADKAIAESTFGEGVDMDTEDLLHSFDILRDDIDEWAKSTGLSISNELKDVLKKLQHDARDLYAKDAKETISDWQKLLEKYAEYEYKKSEIQRKAEQEREVARKHGASQEIFDAIDLKELREIEKLNFDEFQKSATWITATGDLSNLTNKALQMLIDKLWEYKKAAKNLDPKDIIKLNKAMRKLRNEQRKDNPFAAFSISIDEAQERMEQFEPYILDYENKIKKLWEKEIDEGGLDEKDQKRLEEYIKKYKELVNLQKEVGEVPFTDKMKDIGKVVNAFKGVADTFKQIADSTNDFNVKQAADAVSDIIGNFEAAEKGAETWGGWWGAIIGGVTDAIPKIMNWISGNAKIDYNIQQSQIEVKRLTTLYKDLEHAAQDAYGVAEYGAQKALIINKNLQLEQLREQLRLEKSRKSKYQDKEAIIEIQGQINDLENEIHDATNNIVNDLLGISSKADFAEDLVKSMIDAFKQGEDYMKVFEDSFEDMVDNMIMKAIVSRLVGDWINSIWDKVNAKAAESDAAKSGEIDMEKGEQTMKGFVDVDEDLYKYWKKKYEEALAAYNAAITPTPEDIAGLREFFEQGRDDFKNNFLAYMDAFGIKFGEGAGEADLSALQQGIQGITEDTASALEAYMNGVSQQVYLHSDLLTQIRDILINFGGDVTIATNAQILLQLQQSFQVQMTIQNVLTGVLNASGLAFRVELAN